MSESFVPNSNFLPRTNHFWVYLSYREGIKENPPHEDRDGVSVKRSN